MQSNRKKVLCILHLPPPVHGAAVVGQYIQQSDDINSSLNIRYINLSTSDSLEAIGKGGLKKWWTLIKLYTKVKLTLISFRPELCYITLTAAGIGFYKDSLLIFMLKFFRVPYIIHFHNKGVQERQGRKFDDWLYRQVFRNSRVMLLSQLLFPDVQQYLSIDQVRICPNGIPDYQQQRSTLQPTRKRKVRLLYISNLIRTKGILDVVDAMALVKHLPVELQIIGAESDITKEQLLEKIQQLGLEQQVSYLGKQYGEDKMKALEEASVFVFPTYYPNECFPISLLEAMCFNLPIISTTEGAIPDLVIDNWNGLLVERQQIHALAQAIEQLVVDEEKRVEMGINSRKLFLERYTLKNFENNILKYLQE